MNEKSSVTLLNKSFLTVTGVNKIISLDPKHFQIDTVIGILKVFGSELEMQELDSVNKKLNIKGDILEISYKAVVAEKENFIKKIFK